MKTKYISLLLLLSIIVVSCKLEKEKEAGAASVEKEGVKNPTTGVGFKVTFNALVNKDDNFQLFYNEDGSESFTGEEMIQLPVKGSNEAQNIEFLLPDNATPYNFRFDIGSNKEMKEVKFNNFKIEYKGKTFVADAKQFFKYFYPNDQVVLDTINTVAKIQTKDDQAPDPIIGGTLHLRNELEKFYQK